ncbi:probable apyrase 7 [Mercurialis annua]|uniref:probable apyrase 7 n=1 Tax=Mercurialis annua TaxID=3986 RepID=UPI00215ECC11|nr:probable apyrase 7 [Mercurialis annua]
MVFHRVVDFISAATSRLPTSKASSAQYISTGSSPPPGDIIGYEFNNASGQKNNLRLSSSLQDFSSYRRLDLEGGDYNVGSDRKPPLLQREKAGASFSKEKALPAGTPFFQRKWVRFVMIILCLLLLAFLIYFTTTFVSSYLSQGVPKFYVVLDCGSTGTRIYVYRASIEQNKDGNIPIALKSFTEGISRKSSGHAYDRMETEPGLHTLVRNISGLKSAINPLIRWAEGQIPGHAHKTTSLFLYATAGVRRLPAADSKWLLNHAYSILKNSPFFCQRGWVKVISGMDEAYYGWIALNYQKRVLGNSPKKTTFGALDMGGSSLQVTFESKKHGHNETDLDLRIGSARHHLTAYSLAGYGLNDAFDKSVVQILKKLPDKDLVKGGKVEIKHPCLQSGYKEKYICSQCVSNGQGSNSIKVGKNFGKGLKSGVPVQLIGAPNWEECSALAKVAINFSEWSNHSAPLDCDVQPCALAENIPRPYGQFYAMSGFFVVYRFFNLTPEATLDDVLEKGQEFCEQTWEVAKISVPPQPFIEQYCFRAPYIVLLLREGLHIRDDQIRIGSGGITWTLGVALFEAGKAFSPRLRLPSYEILQMNIHPTVFIIVLVTSLILLICALSCAGNCVPRFCRRPYLPLFRHNSASAASVLSLPSPFRFQRWSPINSGDGRVKMPLSPIASVQQGPFGLAHDLNSGGIQLMESSLYSSTGGVSHSYSSSNLGQMMESNSMGSFWSPHRSQMRLQSRRSQSREDLTSSVAEAHMTKV